MGLKVVLHEWYNKCEFKNYLVELWQRLPYIETLKLLDFQSIQSRLRMYGINTENWPHYVKTSFKRCIESLREAEKYDTKKYLINSLIVSFEEFKSLISMTLKCSKN